MLPGPDSLKSLKECDQRSSILDRKVQAELVPLDGASLCSGGPTPTGRYVIWHEMGEAGGADRGPTEGPTAVWLLLLRCRLDNVNP
jgi:hypothetical protein